MFTLKRPQPELIRQTLVSQSDLPFSYATVGMTRTRYAAGNPRNQHSLFLGKGEDVYSRAVVLLQRWTMYDLPWINVYPADTPVESGRIFATVVNHLGFWSINPCRIVYVEEAEDESVRKWSFAIGTLPAHSEKGEERFRVEWDQRSNEVRFEIMALAGPQHWLAWLGYPYVRALQRCFGREALNRIGAAIAQPSH